jgi:hypothetical protein
MYGKFINDKGQLIESTEYHTSHSYFVDEVIREATAFDRAILRIIKELS